MSERILPEAPKAEPRVIDLPGPTAEGYEQAFGPTPTREELLAANKRRSEEAERAVKAAAVALEEAGRRLGPGASDQALEDLAVSLMPRQGVIYAVSKPEHFGQFPVRTEIEVLPADEPSEKKIGWEVRCYDGTEVYKVIVSSFVATEFKEQPLTNFDDIKPGDRLVVQTLVGRRNMIARMDDEDEGLYAECDGLLADLVFDSDDRHCWISTYAINTRCLDRLKR